MTVCYCGGLSFHLHVKMKIDTKVPDIISMYFPLLFEI